MITPRQRFFGVALVIGIIVVAALARMSATQRSGAAKASEPIEVNFNEMSLFDFDVYNGTIDDVPRRFRDLEGKRVTFTSDMWAPHAKEDGITLSSFQAVHLKRYWSDHKPPLPQEFWDCNVPAGMTVRYSLDPVKITGILHVKIKHGDHYIKSVYEVDVQSVEPINGDVPPAARDTAGPDF